MKIKRRDPFTGRENELDLPVTAEQIGSWKSGVMAQDAFPGLTADQREFIISGILPGTFEQNLAEEVPRSAFNKGEGNGTMIAIASDLGWGAGYWPELIKFDTHDGVTWEQTDKFFAYPESPAEQAELGGYIYKRVDGGEGTLKIFND